MLNFGLLEKSLGILSSPYFVHDFSRKMFLMLYSLKWPNFTAWLPLLYEIFVNMFITIVCWQGCQTWECAFKQMVPNIAKCLIYYTASIVWKIKSKYYPAEIYFFEANKRKTTTMCEICSKLTITTPDQSQWCRSGIFILNFELISHCSGVSIVAFKQVNTCWV